MYLSDLWSGYTVTPAQREGGRGDPGFGSDGTAVIECCDIFIFYTMKLIIKMV